MSDLLYTIGIVTIFGIIPYIIVKRKIRKTTYVWSCGIYKKHYLSLRDRFRFYVWSKEQESKKTKILVCDYFGCDFAKGGHCILQDYIGQNAARDCRGGYFKKETK